MISSPVTKLRRTRLLLPRISRVKMVKKNGKRNKMKSSLFLPLRIWPSADFAGIANSQLITLFYRSANAVEVSSSSITSVSEDGCERRSTGNRASTTPASTGDSSSVRFARPHFRMCSGTTVEVTASSKFPSCKQTI